MREEGIDPQLEKLADQFLKETAKSQPCPVCGGRRKRCSNCKGQGTAIRKNGRGFTAYARAYGMTTKKIEEKLREVEVTGLDLELALRPIGVRHSKVEVVE